MAEYIEREAAKEAVVMAIGKGYSPFNAIVMLPAADVVPMSWVREHMSGDYISREQAVENVIDQMRHSASETAMRERLLNLVAADVRPVVVCADCKHNNACLTQAFVEDESRVPFDRNTFFCADGKRADDA